MRLAARIALASLSSSLGFTALASFAGDAHAQSLSTERGFAIDRFDPSERGSNWFALDSLDLRGNARPSFGVVMDYAYRPLIAADANGNIERSIVRNDGQLHLGGSFVVANRIRFGADLPLTFQTGHDVIIANGNGTGTLYRSPTDSAGVGDLRLGADVRLVGQYGDAFTLAFGAQVYIPTGSADDFNSDGEVRIQPRFTAAGDVGAFAYALKAGVMIRPRTGNYEQAELGSELTFGAAAGLHVLDKRLTVGPEIFGSTGFQNFFGSRETPVEALIGAHADLGAGFRLGAGIGTGVSPGYGSPALRELATLEWSQPVPPADKDNDGILDSEDACPSVPGIRTNDPSTNGCPAKIADRDEDGIADAEDACPDIRGVRTGDPKTNGCPADRDGDTVPDAVDACPDVPGVASDDPKTNGCPPDRDHDSIVDSQDACPDIPGVANPNPKLNGCPPDRDGDGIMDGKDACPDEPGPANADPTKNGCPHAVVKNGQIRINEQIKFRFDKSEIDPASDPILDDVAKVMKDHPEITKIRIEGHTDDKGSAAYNKKLSADRATAIKKWLLGHGIATTRMTSVGLGSSKPLDTNATDDGRRNNRRVEFHIEGGPGATPANEAATPAAKPKP